MSTAAGSKQRLVFSIKDQKAVSDQLLPQLPQGFKPRGLHVSEWKIKDWFSTLPTSLKRSSPEFECGGHQWQIHLFPLGLVKPRQQEQIVPTPKTSIALYIVHSDNCHHSDPWKVEADVVVAICNSQSPSVFIKQTYHHQFTPTTALAGSHEFRRLRDIVRPLRTGSASILVNGVADVVVYLRTSEAVSQGRLASRNKPHHGANIPATPTTGTITTEGCLQTPKSASARHITPPPRMPASEPATSQSPNLGSNRSLASTSHLGRASENIPSKDVHPAASTLHTSQPSVGDMRPNSTSSTVMPNSPVLASRGDDQHTSPDLHEPIFDNVAVMSALESSDFDKVDGKDHAQDVPQERSRPSAAVTSKRHRRSASPSAADEELAIETMLEVCHDETIKEEEQNDKLCDHRTQQRPAKRRKYYDALDIVLAKAIVDQKRSELKVGHLEGNVKEKEAKIKALKDMMGALSKEKRAALDQLNDKSNEYDRLQEEMNKIKFGKDEAKRVIARFASDLERTLVP